MKYKYETEADSTKLLYAKQIHNLPSDITLAFNNIYIRFYKSQEDIGFFYCRLAIPAFKDEDGYVCEFDFSENDSKNEVDSWLYEVPLNDHDFDSISNCIECFYTDITEMGHRMLLLNMKIKGTPFNGHVFIDRDFYR